MGLGLPLFDSILMYIVENGLHPACQLTPGAMLTALREHGEASGAAKTCPSREMGMAP